MHKKFIPIFVFVFACVVGVAAVAQINIKSFTGSDFEGVRVPTPSFEKKDAFFRSDPRTRKDYIYEPMTMKTLSYMVWAIGYADPEKKDSIDDFIKVNECDIYKEFSTREIDWEQIRKATQSYIIENKIDFPTRFKFIQPLRLLQFDQEKNSFAIDPKYIIQGARRFEILADDYNREVCSDPKVQYMEYVPRGLVLELSRPFTMTSVSATNERAKEYLAYIAQKENQLADKGRLTRLRSMELREAYLVLKIKIFSFRTREQFFSSYRINVPQVMAGLEGFDVYGDPGHTILLYSRSFLSNKDAKQINKKIAEEYEVLHKKSEAEGLLN